MKIRIQIELRITSNPYPLRIIQPIHCLTNSLNFNCPLRQRPFKLTGSKSGGPTLGSGRRRGNSVSSPGGLWNRGKPMFPLIKKFVADELGVTAIEYALIAFSDRRLHHHRGPNRWRQG
jgi:hypothetical protein